jgi:peptidoglycan/xylan/chitin deacetylase (PgdA/CDA1 family)
MNIKRFAKMLFRTAIALDAVFPLRVYYRRKLLILFYHGVSENPSSQPQHQDGRHVALEKFRCQMEYIKKKYTVLSLNTAVQFLLSGDRFPRNPVVVTFDDGYRNNLDEMYPVIERLGIPVTIFVTTDFAHNSDSRTHLNWREIRSLHEKGILFGSHTQTHPHLTRIPENQISRELRLSKEELESSLGSPVDFLSYPYGENDDTVRRLAKAAGYRAACTVCYGTNDHQTDSFGLRRIAVNDNYSFEFFIAALFPGLFSLVRGVCARGSRERL